MSSEKDVTEALGPLPPTGDVEWVEDITAEEEDREGVHRLQFPRRPSSQELMASWTGTPSVRGGSETMRMVLLTFSAIGITFTWGIEMTCMVHPFR